MPRYFRYTLRGRHSAEAANAALGPVVTGGLVVRTDTGDHETHVIVAADAPPHAGHTLPGTVQATGEVQEVEVLRAP